MEQEIVAMWAQVFVALVVGLVQCGLIAWGLRRMGIASEERNRQLDQQAEVLGKIGQALDHQGAALDRQGEMMTEALQGFRQQNETLAQQNEVLAELLRRSA